MARQSGAPRGASSFSMLGPDTAITGDIRADADIHVEGRIEGDVACHGLVQGERSTIIGTVRAETVRLAGTLRGIVTARDVVILATARIEGDVSYETLTMELGAQLAGTLKPGGAEAAPAIALTARPEAELILTAAE
ncbi:polymer-forming cytoskeletal protein [Novosphingobium colocasiae]|uniref:Polymer-forming cytoskeletal protein n=1 Tax=Novosphingobium colocasiae TaxID=1256513 RepID=A0A918UFL7_9SPHN|nr:polymer-forming cytoskeletal protein [Novosphingobium colocasiae]GGZ04755.1 hypothetical protein GCM10011614_19490 [Novosphingobium colocasiae]